jgi:hypothetical protein
LDKTTEGKPNKGLINKTKGGNKMGDRAMAEIKTTDGSLYIYTHWGGHDLPESAKEAIVKAKPRWDDEPYAVRILVDQLTKEGRDEETGFGLMLKPNAEDEYNNDNPSVVIDLPEQKLLIYRDDKEDILLFRDLNKQKITKTT